jgi:RNA polymerase sigma-70 factor (ECF subfamily)
MLKMDGGLGGVAFRDAYVQLRPFALRVAQSVLRDEAAAEDVVQDVFLQLWRRPAAYDPRRGTLRTFVLMLTRSRAVDRLRSTVSRRAAVERAGHELRFGAHAAESCEEPVIRREGAHGMLAAVATLPPGQRDAVVLTGLGLSAGEIARTTGVPLGTAKSRVRIGLDRARTRASAAA